MGGALEGIKVVDLSRILAGPYCGQMLSDLGAEVVKVEAPWGDDTRTWGPPFLDDGTAAYHLSCNRGKSFIQANLKQDPESVMSLINSADVVIENFKPGGLQSLLGTLPDHLIVCSISAFGTTGPRRDEPGYDLALQALSGIMSITGETGGMPVKVGVAWIDIITGLYAGNAILAALFHRERRGEGQVIDLSLWDCAIASLANQGQNWLSGNMIPGKLGSGHPNLVPYQAFLAKDGWMVIAAGNDRHWENICKAMRLPHIHQTNAERISHREEIISMLQEVVNNYTMQEVIELLKGIPCAPIQNIQQALEDPQSIARQAVWDVDGYATLASPLRFMSKTPARPRN